MRDIRFTVKDDVLYAICLGWPDGPVNIESLKSLYPAEIEHIQMLGVDQPLAWSHSQAGLTITPPAEKPCEHAFVFKIQRKHPFPR
jgi:alpha-L-fucosidase